MRLDPIFDSLYALGSLWGVLTGPPVCTSGGPPLPAAAREVVRSLEPRASGAVLAIVDVHVVPMDTERVLANQTVVVQDGRITALGPTSRVEVPAGATKIDGRGKYLIPGLGDMHFGIAHGIHAPHDYPSQQQALAGKALAYKLFRNLARGVTTVRGFEGFVNADELRQFKDFLETAELTSPRIYPALNIGRAMRPESVAVHAAAAKAAGARHLSAEYELKARTPEERAVFDSLVAAARRLRLPVSAHSHALPLDAVLALGTTGGSTEHTFMLWDTLFGKPGPLSTGIWPGMPDTRPRVDLTRSLAKVPPLATALQRAGVWVTPTLRCMESVHAHLTGLPQLVKTLHDAGVRLLLGGDDGFDVHHELAALVRAGLTSYQALLTGTRHVAEYFGHVDSGGTVAVGKWADLVLLQGNPLQDIRHTREPAGVMIAGRWLDRAALDRGLVDRPPAELNEQMVSAPKGKVRQSLLMPPAGSEARSRSWILLELARGGIRPGLGREQRSQLEGHIARFAALADSLAVESSDRRAADRMRRAQAQALGAIRAGLSLEQRETFDAIARVWLREQVRQGYEVEVSGVPLVP